MLPAQVNTILAPYRLELTDNGTRIRSMDFEFGTVGIEAVYEMMFLHQVTREQALQDVAMLLNTASPKKKKPKKKVKSVLHA